MVEVCLSLETLYSNRKPYNNTVELAYGEIVRTEDDGDEWFDLYNDSGSMACMDGEVVLLKSIDGNVYTFINSNGEKDVDFKLTKEEVDHAVFSREFTKL